MYYRKNNLPQRVNKRIQRRKRARYYNDAALFNESSYSTERKRTKSLLKRQQQLDQDTNDVL